MALLGTQISLIIYFQHIRFQVTTKATTDMENYTAEKFAPKFARM